MTPDERRASWARVSAEKTAAGLTIEQAPEFKHWIEQWISGALSMTEVSRRYTALIKSRQAARHSPEATTSALGQLLDDVSGIDGIKPRDPQERAASTNAIQRAWSDV
ncbi:hypothetical protein [Pararhizobium sp.]|uniref:hypothetical protein n=1 Tax=Pararhizobium sp. TaxID=1977563 RepID=UPI002726173B|nr:hypothetical protein [Pararhizobium sp.]MDO9415560.1 hypothetical protein [Pararhizobium sp.]